jgi:hypothetical protein
MLPMCRSRAPPHAGHMKWKRTLAGSFALACGIFAAGAGPAHASTITTTSYVLQVPHDMMPRAGLRPDAGTGPSGLCVAGTSDCSYDSGWISYGDGGCQVDTTVGFRMDLNQLLVIVEVQSPYLFAGCTAVSTVHFQTFSGLDYSSAGFWGYACSETDFTCKSPHADPGTWGYYPEPSGVPAAQSENITGMWVTDTT